MKQYMYTKKKKGKNDKLICTFINFFFFNVDIYRMECRVRDGGRDNYWGSMRWRGSR